jgi:hypothetical protein
MRSHAAWALFAVVLAHAGMASADCKDDTAAFEDYMRGLDRGFELVVMPSHTTLVSRKDLAATPHALQVNLTSAGISVGLDAIELAKLGKELAVRARMQAEPDWQKGTPGWVGHYQDLELFVDESVPWSEVVTVAGLAAHAGFTHVYFVFARAEQAVPPPHTSIDDIVRDAKNESDRMMALVPARKSFQAACPALTRAFGAIPQHTATWYRDTFVPGFGKALAACDCKVDLAELRSWMFYELTPVVQTGSLDVTLARTGKTIALPGKTPWREASKKLGGGAVWLVAR